MQLARSRCASRRSRSARPPPAARAGVGRARAAPSIRRCRSGRFRGGGTSQAPRLESTRPIRRVGSARGSTRPSASHAGTTSDSADTPSTRAAGRHRSNGMQQRTPHPATAPRYSAISLIPPTMLASISCTSKRSRDVLRTSNAITYPTRSRAAHSRAASVACRRSVVDRKIGSSADGQARHPDASIDSRSAWVAGRHSVTNFAGSSTIGGILGARRAPPGSPTTRLTYSSRW